MSKTGIYWSENSPARTQTKSCNILRERPGPVRGSRITTPQEAFESFITHDIIDEVIQCTNLEGRRVAAARGKVWKKIDYEEIIAFIGLTLLAGVEKNWDVSMWELFSDPLQNPVYKATMSVRRYEDIRRLLRFDDKRTRAERLKTDHMAAFRHIWELFLTRCRTTFIPSKCVTIDEQLVPFRGRCKFKQYMPSKPAKYGIKIFWLCDSFMPFAIDGIIYLGKQPGDAIQKNLGENIVISLSSGLKQSGNLKFITLNFAVCLSLSSIMLHFVYNYYFFYFFAGCNITMDNFFTTVPLAEKLLKQNLTLVGTLRKCKPDIPTIMKPAKSRELNSSAFGFTNNLTMVSYCPKKSKAVILLSSMHNDKSVDDGEKKKPQIILYYKTKGGVDTVNQMVRNYSCKRITWRWPTVLWHNMLDIASLNAFTIFKVLLQKDNLEVANSSLA